MCQDDAEPENEPDIEPDLDRDVGDTDATDPTDGGAVKAPATEDAPINPVGERIKKVSTSKIKHVISKSVDASCVLVPLTNLKTFFFCCSVKTELNTFLANAQNSARHIF